MASPSPTTNIKGAASTTATAATKIDAAAGKSPKVLVKKLSNVGDQLRKLPAPSFRQVKVTNTKATSVGLIGRLTFGDLDKPRTVNEDHSVAFANGPPDHGLSGDTTTDATVGEDEPFTVSIGGTRRLHIKDITDQPARLFPNHSKLTTHRALLMRFV
uniref:Uncharacterized protein n=1 Tax=Romanomermis culicivorax TaxID=13658 RepID=A0A915I3M7_ROMCU